MIDIVALIATIAPYAIQLVGAVFSFITYLKAGQIHAAVNKPAPVVSDSVKPS